MSKIFEIHESIAKSTNRYPVVVVLFGAPSCPDCRLVKKTISDFLQRKTDSTFCCFSEYNIYELQGEHQALGITKIPHIRMYYKVCPSDKDLGVIDSFKEALGEVLKKAEYHEIKISEGEE